MAIVPHEGAGLTARPEMARQMCSGSIIAALAQYLEVTGLRN
jgi:hypothetical protein